MRNQLVPVEHPARRHSLNVLKWAVEAIPVDHGVAGIYAELVASLRKRGTPLPTNDIWIAATAARTGATLVAYDAHFTLIERIGLVLLQTPPDAG